MFTVLYIVIFFFFFFFSWAIYLLMQIKLIVATFVPF